MVNEPRGETVNDVQSEDKTPTTAAPTRPILIQTEWADRLRRDVERALRERVAQGTRARRVESFVKGTASWGFSRLKRHAGIGVAIAGGLGWLAADAVGVGEVTLILGFAYVAYEVLHKGVPFDEAVAGGRKIMGGD